jgi:hypothetical protein
MLAWWFEQKYFCGLLCLRELVIRLRGSYGVVDYFERVNLILFMDINLWLGIRYLAIVELARPVLKLLIAGR